MNDIIEPWYDDDFPAPHLDPPELNNGPVSDDDERYVRAFNAKFEFHIDDPHWSELPKSTRVAQPRDWYDQDNAPESPLDQDLEEN